MMKTLAAHAWLATLVFHPGCAAPAETAAQEPDVARDVASESSPAGEASARDASALLEVAPGMDPFEAGRMARRQAVETLQAIREHRTRIPWEPSPSESSDRQSRLRALVETTTVSGLVVSGEESLQAVLQLVLSLIHI